jgi:Uma2 family endonuclease
MPVTEETFRQLSLEDPEGQWELVCGKLRQKPTMTHSHRDVSAELFFQLRSQLPRERYRVQMNHSKLRLPGGNYYVPDVAVIPIELTAPYLGKADELDAYDAPLPLVVEVWSKSTGDYDVTAKLPDYRARGDHEIWLLHPHERRLTAWVRQPGGEYIERHFATNDVVEPVSLPGVRIDLAAVFAQ